MRAFHMNLLEYNANTAFPVGGQRTDKQTRLRAEMAHVSQNGETTNIAGLTEVLVANGATEANCTRALNDLADALNIPCGTHGQPRHIALIRCGRTALQNSNEVVAIVLDSRATVIDYSLIYFRPDRIDSVIRSDIAPNASRFTARLAIPEDLTPDYRYVVRVRYRLNDRQYSIGFIHNRAPRNDQVTLTMQFIRNLLALRDNDDNAIGLCGGDFNTTPPIYTGNGIGFIYPPNGNHSLSYYSPGMTTGANAYDYWIGRNQLLRDSANNISTASQTPNAPHRDTTGSDHRGVWIDIA